MSEDLPDSLKRSARTSGGNTSKIFIGIVGILIIAGLSFWGGTKYHSGAKAATTTAAKGYGGGFDGAGGRGGYGGGFGSVTAISSTSISTQNERSGTTTTYAITSSTVITDNGATVTYGDIQVGDTVIVQPSSSSATTAATIIVNPNVGGGGQATGTAD